MKFEKLISNKRGAEITLQLIIVAVLVLIVLVVLIVIFSQRTGKFVGGVSSCTAKGGACAQSLSECSNVKVKLGLSQKEVIWSALPDTDCKEPAICCIPTVTS